MIVAIIHIVAMEFVSVIQDMKEIFPICKFLFLFCSLPHGKMIILKKYDYYYYYSCVHAGSCGGAYCAENAICSWEPIQKISYCLCPEGFEGDGVRQCKSIPPPCNVRNNCGLYGSCVPSQK